MYSKTIVCNFYSVLFFVSQLGSFCTVPFKNKNQYLCEQVDNLWTAMLQSEEEMWRSEVLKLFLLKTKLAFVIVVWHKICYCATAVLKWIICHSTVAGLNHPAVLKFLQLWYIFNNKKVLGTLGLKAVATHPT